MTEATFYSTSCIEQTLKAMMPTNALPLWKTLLPVVVIKRVNTVVILLFWYSLSESHINISQVMQHCLCHVEAFWFLTYLVVYKVILSYSVFQEKTCEESASFDLTSFDIASCIEDIAQCIELIECREQNELAVEEGAGTINYYSVKFYLRVN